MRDEKGYTYVEVIISLSVLVLLIPSLFLATRTFEGEIGKQAGRQRLEAEVLSFVPLLEQDVKRASHFRKEGEALVIGFPDGSSVRYEHRNRRLIRSVKEPTDSSFGGTMIVLDNVYFAAWMPDDRGVEVELGLQNWTSSMDVTLYLSERNEQDNAG
ncbi:hypothetical protein [Staphylospora marina]|uniref:hypothetical protein n=1 Tax=Staphylospora marina TaxID=2490858 RepID=UPI000F5BED41|nr:hypothetical protein [Staphylospora marina]